MFECLARPGRSGVLLTSCLSRLVAATDVKTFSADGRQKYRESHGRYREVARQEEEGSGDNLAPGEGRLWEGKDRRAHLLIRQRDEFALGERGPGGPEWKRGRDLENL